jgi:hypothetical protein
MSTINGHIVAAVVNVQNHIRIAGTEDVFLEQSGSTHNAHTQ